jgi:ABC-type dipeptide/oligopeptide/nickel transport system ATPase component
MIMRGGALVEEGRVEQVIRTPREEYTRRLVESVLEIKDE